jgi:hypothetical protein
MHERIEVTATGTNAWRVVVHAAASTEHEVTVPTGMADRFGVGGPALVEASFRFLLAREPASAILRRFSLDVIGGYFPEYEEVLPELL